MDQLPASKGRYAVAMIAWIVFTVVFAALLLYRLIVGPQDVLWIGVAGIGSFIGIWRWIRSAHKTRSRGP
jgi:hypothetical protein